MELGVAMTKTLDLYVSMKDLVMMNEAARSFIQYFREHIRTKQASPDDGLLSNLIRKNIEDKSGLTEEELISIGIFLFTAGEETSAGLISNAFLQFCKHPEQLRILRAHPELLEPAIEEVLRYDSVVQLLGRVAKEDVIIRGKVIPAGAAVTLVVASGNRDEDAFDAPDRFDITRKPNRHLSFGSGIHYCLGDWLGRKQSQMALRAFLDRFQDIHMPQQDLRWYKNIAVRRLSGLSLSCREV
jgi:cytochrome P450